MKKGTVKSYGTCKTDWFIFSLHFSRLQSTPKVPNKHPKFHYVLCDGKDRLYLRMGAFGAQPNLLLSPKNQSCQLRKCMICTIDTSNKFHLAAGRGSNILMCVRLDNLQCHSSLQRDTAGMVAYVIQQIKGKNPLILQKHRHCVLLSH